MNIVKNIFFKNKKTKNNTINTDNEIFTRTTQEQQIKQSQEDTQNFELTCEMQDAINSIKNPKNQIIWIYGKAGTGKSTFLNYLKNTVKQKNTVYLAPTGMSALLISGQTIHSFFQIQPTSLYIQNKSKSDYNRSLLNKLSRVDLIVIDEISMVRADLLDEIDYELRIATENDTPFGGIKMLFLGDPYQLPPVLDKNVQNIFMTKYKSAYFFSSTVIRNNLSLITHIEFTKVFRQTDENFLNILSSLRLAENITTNTLESINSRITYDEEIPKNIIRITGTKAQAENYNLVEYTKINSQERTFIYTGEGNIPQDKDLPCPKNIKLKIGTQILLIANDQGKSYVNGTVATITDFKDDYIIAKKENGAEIFIKRHTWEGIKYDLVDGEIVEKIDYTYTQYPILYGWAMTIHKAQGKTFEKVYIDLSTGAFTEGQAYVAVSRVKSIDGLYLKTKLYTRDFFTNGIIKKYFNYIKLLKK